MWPRPFIEEKVYLALRFQRESMIDGQHDNSNSRHSSQRSKQGDLIVVTSMKQRKLCENRIRLWVPRDRSQRHTPSGKAVPPKGFITSPQTTNEELSLQLYEPRRDIPSATPMLHAGGGDSCLLPLAEEERILKTWVNQCIWMRVPNSMWDSKKKNKVFRARKVVKHLRTPAAISEDLSLGPCLATLNHL